MKAKSLQAVFWLMLSQLGTQSLSAIFSLWIASLLSPAIYGDFAAITIPYIVINAVTESCSNKIIIKRNLVSPALVKHICAIVAVLGLISLFFVSVISLVISGKKTLFCVAVIAGIAQLLKSISSIFESVLQRNMLMKDIAKKNVFASLLAGIFCLLLARFGFGIYALAFQLLFASFFSLIVAAKYSPTRFHVLPLNLNANYIFSIINTSKIYVPVQLFSIANRESLRISVGLLLGPYSLGLVTGAQKLITIIQSLVSSSVNKSVFPVICELLRSKKENFNLKYLRLISLSLSLITFVFLAAWLLAADFVTLLLGSKWVAIIPLIPPLLLSGWATSIGWLNNQTMFAISQEKKQVVFGFSRLLVGIFYLIASSVFGLIPMCYMGAFRSAIIDPLHIKFLTSKLDLPLEKYFYAVFSAVVPGVFVITFFNFFIWNVDQSSASVIDIMLNLASLTAIFFGISFILNDELKRDILDIPKMLARKNIQ